MKRIYSNIPVAVLMMAGLLFISSCNEKDELGFVEDNMLPLVYITSSTDGVIEVNVDDAVIDKTQKVVTRILGIHRSGIQRRDAFSIDVAVNTENLPANTTALQPGDYTLSADSEGAQPVTRVDIPDGESSAPLYFSISKSVLDANTGKLLAVNVAIANPSKYQLNEGLSSVTIVVDVNTFQEKAVNVTDTYLKNPGPPFVRADNDGTRFGILKDWTVNDAVKNIDGGTHGGFDSYGGGAYMAMERWGTPAIPNGKIYQTVTLPKGKYQIDVDFQAQGISNVAYIAVAAGSTLPDVENIDSSIAYTTFNTPGFQFTLDDETEVSMGIVANLINDQQYFRARSFKLTRYESVFD
jgi:hypothetical protein